MKRLFLTLTATLLTVIFAAAQTAVTPPADAEQKDYSFFGIYHDPQNGESTEEEPVKVAVSGTDIYLQLPNPVNGLAWIKGTIEGDKATFPCQYLASYQGKLFYVTGRSEGDVIGPIVFSYSEDIMTCSEQYLQFTDDLAGQNVYGYFTGIIVNKVIPDDDVVQVPGGLQTQAYEFVGNKVLTDQEGNYAGYQETKFDVKVGIYNNSEIYVQGLCTYLPTGWVKGTVTDGSFGDKTVTFKAGQCYGKFGNYQLYFAGRSGNDLTDMLFNYDPQTRTLTNEVGYYLVLNLQKSTPAPVELYATSKMAPKSSNGITTQTAAQTGIVEGYTDLQGRVATAQTHGMVLQKMRMSDGTVKNVKVIRK